MRRSAALAPLSRDHHQALAAALVLRRAGDDPAPAAARFLAFWRGYGDPHFSAEERLVLPALPADHPGWQALCDRVRDEHARIRELAARVEAEPRAEDVHELGTLLHDHVRFEERELFTVLERDLDPEALDRLGAAIDR